MLSPAPRPLPFKTPLPEPEPESPPAEPVEPESGLNHQIRTAAPIINEAPI